MTMEVEVVVWRELSKYRNIGTPSSTLEVSPLPDTLTRIANSGGLIYSGLGKIWLWLVGFYGLRDMYLYILYTPLICMRIKAAV